MKSKPTIMTKKQLSTFAKAVCKWQDLLGVKDWEITIKLDDRPQPDGSSDEGWCDYKLNGRVATIALMKYMPYPMTDTAIKKLAFHEVFHLVLADLDRMAMTDKPYGPNAVDRECHKIIAKLVNLLWNSK
jgi:hypothetical protein